MRSDLGSSEVLCQRIKAEYAEQPALRLTTLQAQRLWGLDRPTCLEVLTTLVDAGVLQRTSDGRFAQRQSAA